MTAPKYRKKIVAGNWKMNTSVNDALELVKGLKIDLSVHNDCDVVICPPFTGLHAVGDAVTSTSIKLGAQNMHWEANGAYTGEVSAAMLRDLYCRYVILGHSERRAYFGETSEIVNKKAKAAIAATLVPIVCVGETLEERESGRMRDVVRDHLEGSLADLGDDLKKVVVAYEPVWAIGTGKTASPDQAQEVHAYIRENLEKIGGKEAAETIRIQYGGSVKPNNAAELFGQPDIDGGLIGGAALEARSFIEIVRAAQ